MLALLTSPPAIAEGPSDADLWIGLGSSHDGFLLDRTTGNLWMTGVCLKQLQPAAYQDGVWISTTRELVSVGRLEAPLEQTFELNVSRGQPFIAVTNSIRGGKQVFDGVTLGDCTERSACGAIINGPLC